MYNVGRGVSLRIKVSGFSGKAPNPVSLCAYWCKWMNLACGRCFLFSLYVLCIPVIHNHEISLVVNPQACSVHFSL